MQLKSGFLFFRDPIGIKLSYLANFMGYPGLSTWLSYLLCDVVLPFLFVLFFFFFFWYCYVDSAK